MKPPELYEHKANMWYQYYTTYRQIKMAMLTRIYQLNREYTMRYYNALAEYKKRIADWAADQEKQRTEQQPIKFEVISAIDTEAQLRAYCDVPVDLQLRATWDSEETILTIEERHQSHDILLTGLRPLARVRVEAEGTDRRGMRHTGSVEFQVTPSQLEVDLVRIGWRPIPEGKGYYIEAVIRFKCNVPMQYITGTFAPDRGDPERARLVRQADRLLRDGESRADALQGPDGAVAGAR